MYEGVRNYAHRLMWLRMLVNLSLGQTNRLTDGLMQQVKEIMETLECQRHVYVCTCMCGLQGGRITSVGESVCGHLWAMPPCALVPQMVSVCQHKLRRFSVSRNVIGYRLLVM